MMVTLKIHQGIARIALNRAERANALNSELVEALISAVNSAISEGVSTLILSGEGKTFCGGLDLSTLNEESEADLAHRLLRIELLLQTLYQAPCYTIALTHGTISGAGADLAAVCNRRIATTRTRYRFPGIRFGILLGTRRLIELVGKRGYSIILEQQLFDSAEARDIGFISDIVEADEWETLTLDIAAHIAVLPEYARREVLGVNKPMSDCQADMGILAHSLIQPGLKTRMQEYWESAQAAARARKA